MTNQPDKQKRLAEELGWTEVETIGQGQGGVVWFYGTSPSGKRGHVPMWWDDLNAAHELGEYFAGRGWKAADDYLYALAKQVGTWDKWALVQATASQRAEAALEVLLRMAEQKEEN
jgi:hypothetical protein